MDAATTTDRLAPRARDFLLASLAAGYPDDTTVEVLTDRAARLTDHPGLGAMAAALAAGLDGLQRRYTGLFDAGKERVSLYETEHGRMRGLAKGHDLADIAGFYLAFGLTPDDREVHEMLDHLAVELEFYGVLLLKHELLAGRADRDGVEVVDDARRKFLADHLGRFAATVAAAPPVQADPVYGPALAWCASLVEEECARLDVTPAPLDFFAAHREGDAVECGATVRLPVVD